MSQESQKYWKKPLVLCDGISMKQTEGSHPHPPKKHRKSDSP